MMKKVLFIAILLLAVALRFYVLSSIPPSASLDEATIGWNAYSLLHTGRDEYGYHLPILLRAYDDYRPALYVYLTIPFIQVLGLSVLPVRLPAVIMSCIAVAMTFFLIRNIFSTYKRRDMLAFTGMLLLAISPWHIYVSRLGHEVNLGLTLVVAALLQFFVGLNKKNGWLIASSLGTFALSFYSYQSEKVFTPLMVVILFVLFYKQLLKYKKQVLIGVVTFAIISLPILIASLSPAALLRLKGTSVFTDNPLYAQSAKNILTAKQKGDLFGQIINNRRITTVEIFTVNYLSHFNSFWLFGNTGEESFKAPNTGLLYVWESPFILLGLLYLLFSREIEKKIKVFLIFWVLIDFIAPGITTQAPHALRAFTLLPVPQIFSAFGLILLFTNLQKQSRGIAIGFCLLVSIIAAQEVSQFAYNYFIVFPIHQSESFQYAMKDAMQYVQRNQQKYQQVIVSNRKNLRDSYMFYLFYTKYDPKQYLRSGGTGSGGFAVVHIINNITFRNINWTTDSLKHGLFVGNVVDFPKRLPESASVLFTSYYLDGTPGVTIIAN